MNKQIVKDHLFKQTNAINSYMIEQLIQSDDGFNEKKTKEKFEKNLHDINSIKLFNIKFHSYDKTNVEMNQMVKSFFQSIYDTLPNLSNEESEVIWKDILKWCQKDVNTIYLWDFNHIYQMDYFDDNIQYNSRKLAAQVIQLCTQNKTNKEQFECYKQFCLLCSNMLSRASYHAQEQTYLYCKFYFEHIL